jgi:hypothetical protein
MGSFNGLGWMLGQRQLSAESRIAAPRLLSYVYFPAVNDMLKTIHTPDQARAWLARVKERGADGIKFFGAPPALMQAALAECKTLGLKSGCHHVQMAVTRMNALTSARWGLTSAEHYYGLPEALFDDPPQATYLCLSPPSSSSFGLASLLCLSSRSSRPPRSSSRVQVECSRTRSYRRSVISDRL